MPSSPNGAPSVIPTTGDQSRPIATSGPTEADQFATVLAAASPTPQRAITPAAAAYLEAALTIMQQYALHRATIDWPTLRARAASIAQGAQTPADTYTAIRVALVALGDQHSFFLPPSQVTALQSGRQDRLHQPAGLCRLGPGRDCVCQSRAGAGA
jgi:hypothetical protein